MKTSSSLIAPLAILSFSLMLPRLATANTELWIGVPSVSASTNWSDLANWSNLTGDGDPGPNGNDVIFGDGGGVGTAGEISSVVDASVNINSLTFTNASTFFQTVLIPAGVTLTSSGGLTVGDSTAIDHNNTTVNFAGDGTLVENGNVTVRNNSASGGGANASIATLDLSGLANFVVANSAGTFNVSGVGSEARATGFLYLAGGSNNITAATLNFAVTTGNSSGAASGIRLGAGTNILNVNTINFGAGKTTSGTMTFAGGTGGLRLRGVSGDADDTSRANLTIARRNNSGSGTPTHTIDLTGGHPVDIKVDTLNIGVCTGNNPGSAQSDIGRFYFDTGTVDVNNLNLGWNSQANVTSTGILGVGGGLLVVGNISLVNQTAGNGSGTLIITNGGKVICSGDLIKTTSTGTGSVSIDTGTLNVAGAIGSVGVPLNAFSLSNATLYLAAAPSAQAQTTTFNCGGDTNLINITSIPVIAGYPAQFELIKYAGTLGGTFNIGRGTLPTASPAYAGYISNNVANGSVDLIVTAGPVPARVLSWRGSTDGNWNTTTPNWFFSTSATTYNELDFVLFDDEATGTTEVNLTTGLTPSSVTVSNHSKAYGFTGTGFLTGNTGLTKDGNGSLFVTNSGLNDFSGLITINAGTLHVGDGNFAGNLGAGAIINNGALVLNRFDEFTLANPISGGGSVTKLATGVAILSGINSYTGATAVVAGTLRAGSTTALGSTEGATTISAGATLDVNAQNLGTEPVIIQGTGFGDAGAILNSGAQQLNALRYVTLAGDATFGGGARWDIRAVPTSNPHTAALDTGGNAYKLTKVGDNQISLVGVAVDPKLGDVEIQQGILGIESAITSLGDPAKKLTVFPGAGLQLYQVTNLLDKVISLGSDGLAASIINNSGANTIVGPITMTNDCTFNVNGTSLTLNGPVSGAVLSKIGTGTLILGGTATHAGTVVNLGQLTLDGTHSGGITNTSSFTSLAGSGTNNGFTDMAGFVLPGGTNSVGTLTLGGLNLQPGASVGFELSSTTQAGGGANDLLVINGDLVLNGNTIDINPRGLLLTGVPYRLFTYTGTLTENSPLFVPSVLSYNFTVNTSIHGQVNLIVSGGPPVWNGGSSSVDNWTDPANWNGVTINPGDSLYFGGNARLNSMNDTADGTSYTDLVFNGDAGAFTLNGNSVNLAGNIVSFSTNSQTVRLGLSSGVNNSFNGGPGGLIVGGGFTNTANLTTLTLAGNGTLTNLLANATGAETNTLILNDTNGIWTLVDNASSTPMTIPTVLDIQAGTFNFGLGDSAPVLSSLSAGGLNARLGVIPDAPAVFNMVNGTLDILARFNTGAAGKTIATLNQTGGHLIVEDVFQGADSSATAVSVVNVSGGTLTVGESEGSPNSLFLCSRGTGTLNVSGTGLVRCGTLDMSRNASSAGTTGTVHLDGGTLDVQRVSTGTSATGSGGAPTATFYFNGGVLKARQSRADFFVGRLTGPAIPIVSIVKSGGAIIDSAGFNVSVDEPLQHDSSLGSTPDGGLTKQGQGTLTLTAASSYSGATVVNGGTLAVNGSLGTGTVSVGANGTLAGTGTLGGAVTVDAGGAIAPAGVGVIGTLTVVGNVSLGGETVLDVNRDTAAKDLLTTSGDIAYGGTLTVTNLAGVLRAGDTFKVFEAANYLGGFSAVTPPAAGLRWNTNALSTTGTISVIAVPQPAVTSVVFSGGTLIVNGNNGLPNAPYQVLTSTDVSLPLTSWTPVASGNFDGSGNFSFTEFSPVDPQRYYAVQAE